jgi:hypothetical protein
MKAIIFSNGDTDADKLEIKNFVRSLGINKLRVESYDPVSRRGAELAETYGAMSFPAVVITSEDGAVRGFWQGGFPSPSEVSLTIGYV